MGGIERQHGKALGSPRKAPDEAPEGGQAATDGDNMHGPATTCVPITGGDGDGMGPKKNDDGMRGVAVVAERYQTQTEKRFGHMSRVGEIFTGPTGGLIPVRPGMIRWCPARARPEKMIEPSPSPKIRARPGTLSSLIYSLGPAQHHLIAGPTRPGIEYMSAARPESHL